MFDKCVICQKETDYTTDVDINDRINYIEGSGQLCPTCSFEVYGFKPRYNSNLKNS